MTDTAMAAAMEVARQRAIVKERKMTPQEYDRERSALQSLYGDSAKEAAAKRDQALADLFYRSGWTQEELAKREEKSQQYIAYRLRFGRFLNFTTVVVNSDSLPKNLTEGRFRGYWEETKDEGNERIRFQIVLKLISNDTIVKKKAREKIGPDIVDQFADGKWHALDTIITRIGGPADHIESTLEGIRYKEIFGATCEKKQVGTSFHYRLFRKSKSVSSSELITKLAPIIDGLKAEGRKNMATMSPGTVARLTALLQNLLDEWR